MNLSVEFKGKTGFSIACRDHTVVTDQPIDDGGDDTGMSPVELFIGSLASCVGYFVSRYCARHNIDCKGLTIGATWSMAEQPHRVGSVDLQIHLPAELSPSLQERLLKVAHGCTVHQSIAVAPQVTIQLAAPAGMVRAS